MPRGIVKKLFSTVISEKYYRPFYAIMSCYLLFVFYLWIPLPVIVWDVKHELLRNAIFGKFCFKAALSVFIEACHFKETTSFCVHVGFV